MKRWRFDILLLIALLSTCLVIVSADDEDDEDGVTIESEKIVRSYEKCENHFFFLNILNLSSQEYPKPAHESLDSIINYESPVIQPGKYHIAEHFDDPEQFEEKWVRSTAKKGDGEAAYDGEWAIEAADNPILRNDLGLVMKSKARHSAVASRLVKPFVFHDKPLIVQYEVLLQVSEIRRLINSDKLKCD